MFLLLFAPIPVAVVYEGFRKHRLNILVGKQYYCLVKEKLLKYLFLCKKADRIKRRKALWACF